MIAPATEETRWKPFWLGTYFVALACSTLMALRPEERPRGTPLVIVIGVAVVAATCHALMAVRRPHAHRRTLPMLAWAIVLVLLTSALVWMAPVYLFAASFLFAQIFLLMPSRSAAASAIAFCALLFSPIQTSLGSAVAMTTFFSGVGAAIFSTFVSSVIDQSRERRRVIKELHDTELLLAEVAKRSGEMEERARIARELHDTVTQDLVGITMQLEAAKRGGDAGDVLERVHALSRGALAEARELVHGNTTRGETSSLEVALRSLDRPDGTSVTMAFVIDDALPPIDFDQQAVLLRVAREAVSNARRHAKAKRITITLSATATTVLLDVHDDGCGFDLAAARARAQSRQSQHEGGFGLPSMRDRVRSARGVLDVESTPGEGTVVHVELPVVRPLPVAQPRAHTEP